MSQNVGGSSEENPPRKRVGKACDRCRNKKSKCDGSWPCNRCRDDNMVCLFGERDKAHDKVWPKGTVELQQKALTYYEEAIIQLYNRALAGCPWDGPPVPLAGDNRPLIHGILASLGTCSLGCPIFDEIKTKIVKKMDEDARAEQAAQDDGDPDVKTESGDAEPQSIDPSVQEHTRRPGPTPQESFQEVLYSSSPLEESTPRSAHQRRRAQLPVVALFDHHGGDNRTCHMPPQMALPTPNQSPGTEVTPPIVSSLDPLAYQHVEPQQTWHYGATAPPSGFSSYESTPLLEGSALYHDGMSEGQNYAWPNPEANLGGDDQMLLDAMMNLPTTQNQYGYGEYPFEP